MNKEKILEIANHYTVPKEESSLLVEYNGGVPMPTGETLNLMMWNFCEEELIAFAQSVIEADRESSNEPVGYLTYIEDAGLLFSQDDPESGCYEPLYSRPAPARKPLSDEGILKIATKSPPFIPWLLKEDVTLGDVRGLAVNFARAIEKAHGIGETE